MRKNRTVKGTRGSRAGEIRKFFDRIADEYDAIADDPYWLFSDAVLWELLRSKLEARFSSLEPFRVLDAGCGTGRWSERILRHWPRATATLLDVSAPMLEVARRRMKTLGADARVELVGHDLDLPLPSLPSFDVIICFHNVVGLVADSRKLFARFYGAASDSGILMTVAPNYYQALHLAIRENQLGELKRIEHHRSVRYRTDAPAIRLFTPDSLREELTQAGWSSTTTLGFPIAAYPPDDSSVFEDASVVAQLLRIETTLAGDDALAARGNNLFSISMRGSAPPLSR